MTRTSILQGKMREKGYTIESLAEAMELSKTGLFNKIHNKKEFLVSEVQLLSRLLQLSDEDVRLIFFAAYVEQNSTNAV